MSRSRNTGLVESESFVGENDLPVDFVYFIIVLYDHCARVNKIVGLFEVPIIYLTLII